MIPKNLSELVTFVPNKAEPIHNWFYYKEGFSRKFVEWAVKEFGLKEPIADPFCGVGTTLLAAKQLGLEAVGFDVSPLAAFVAEAKTRDYSTGDLDLIREDKHFSLNCWVKDLSLMRFTDEEQPSTNPLGTREKPSVRYYRTPRKLFENAGNSSQGSVQTDLRNSFGTK